MRRTHHADAVGQLERAGGTGARDHDHRIPHAYREMAALAGLARKVLEHRRRQVHHLDLVERAGGEREQRPSDAIALGVLLLPDVAERHHGLDQMERGRVVQADPLAQFREADAFAMARDLLQNAEGTAERLHTDPLPVLGVIVDVAGCDQPGDACIGRRLCLRLHPFSPYVTVG
jgi:hypothetical protein